MNYKQTFLIAFALLLGCGTQAMATVFTVDTIYNKNYPYTVNKLIPRPGTDYTYGFIYSYDDETTQGLVKFSDVNGDSLALIHNNNKLFYSPMMFINDTNYFIGSTNYAEIYDIRTGKSKPILTDYDQLVGYLPNSNSVILQKSDTYPYDVGGYLQLFNLDSQKVVRSNYGVFHPVHWGDYPKTGKCVLSPQGTYICRMGSGPVTIGMNPNDSTLYYDYIMNVSDFSIKYVLRDTVSYQQDNNFHYYVAVFNDQETLLALTGYNDKYIDIFNLSENRIVKRMNFNEKVWRVGMKFDSTGKYLMFQLENFQVFLNTETYQIDYMTDLLPTEARSPFTNILSNSWQKFWLREDAADVYDGSEYSCDVIINSNGISINSNESIDIKNIKIYDANGANVFTKNEISQTPIDLNINLSTGVYFVILNINGNNEYHKILVQ